MRTAFGTTKCSKLFLIIEKSRCVHMFSLFDYPCDSLINRRKILKFLTDWWFLYLRSYCSNMTHISHQACQSCHNTICVSNTILTTVCYHKKTICYNGANCIHLTMTDCIKTSIALNEHVFCQHISSNYCKKQECVSIHTYQNFVLKHYNCLGKNVCTVRRSDLFAHRNDIWRINDGNYSFDVPDDVLFIIFDHLRVNIHRHLLPIIAMTSKKFNTSIKSFCEKKLIGIVKLSCYAVRVFSLRSSCVSKDYFRFWIETLNYPHIIVCAHKDDLLPKTSFVRSCYSEYKKKYRTNENDITLKAFSRCIDYNDIETAKLLFIFGLQRNHRAYEVMIKKKAINLCRWAEDHDRDKRQIQKCFNNSIYHAIETNDIEVVRYVGYRISNSADIFPYIKKLLAKGRQINTEIVNYILCRFHLHKFDKKYNEYVKFITSIGIESKWVS